MKRERSCTDPAPALGGEDCAGDAFQSTNEGHYASNIRSRTILHSMLLYVCDDELLKAEVYLKF